MRCLIDFTFFRTYTFAFADPVPPTSGLLAGRAGTATVSNIEALLSRLLYTQLPLFERYHAMFALRKLGSPLAVDALEFRHGFFG